jgi:molybdopterin synthase catalytic subunit
MFAMTEECIDLAAIVAHVSDPAAGAVTSLLRLEYEAYADMAVAEFEKIAAEAAGRWELVRVAIVHRVGVVPLGEASVGIAVSAPHRRESIEACHYCIDALKLVAPIWKKEYFEGGEVWIGSLADCDHGGGEAHGCDDTQDHAHGHVRLGPKEPSSGG